MFGSAFCCELWKLYSCVLSLAALGSHRRSACWFPWLPCHHSWLNRKNFRCQSYWAEDKVEAETIVVHYVVTMSRNGDFTPPEGFCIGVFAFLSSVTEVPFTVKELQEWLRSSWAPGVTLRLLVILPSSANPEDLSDKSLSSIYLASVLYLVGRNNRISLRRIHPFTGAVLQMNSDTNLFPSPLQVININKRSKRWCQHADAQLHWIQDAVDGVVTAVTLAFPPFVSYAKDKDGNIQRKDCIDFRILDTLAEFYKIRVWRKYW